MDGEPVLRTLDLDELNGCGELRYGLARAVDRHPSVGVNRTAPVSASSFARSSLMTSLCQQSRESMVRFL
ncbi:hypothetical protein [Nocardia cyriacigeorgica]|uniref:hypothetical protein n=1 Tax=Nocardia cyriacigeorgica TaxID=135487 RepID=UPI001E642C68|nr:hypothetical protein [Nocardia cyriacigeorgica]